LYTTDDEGGNVKPRGSLNQRSCNSDTLYTRLGLLLSRDSNSRSFTEDVSLSSINSKPVSSNGSPVSTLTGSSETEHKAIKEQLSDSIGSLMSMSGQSNGSCSPLTRRHSVTSELNFNMQYKCLNCLKFNYLTLFTSKGFRF